MDVPTGLQSRTRRDFLRLLGQLGASAGVSYCQFDAETRKIRDIQHIYLRCHYDRWLEAFGEPATVFPGLDWTAAATVRTWQQPCVDGPVLCIGYWFEQPVGVRWVIVVRVCFS